MWEVCKANNFYVEVASSYVETISLQMGNPWEIPRTDVSYPVRLYGEVISGPNGSKQWIGGENILAVAYDVPIPGYKTRTTINLRLWSTKVSPREFDLRAFNAGDHDKAYAAMKNAEKVCESFCFVPRLESCNSSKLNIPTVNF